MIFILVIYLFLWSAALEKYQLIDAAATSTILMVAILAMSEVSK
jgi:hypothetical protein